MDLINISQGWFRNRSSPYTYSNRLIAASLSNMKKFVSQGKCRKLKFFIVFSSKAEKGKPNSGGILDSLHFLNILSFSWSDRTQVIFMPDCKHSLNLQCWQFFLVPGSTVQSCPCLQTYAEWLLVWADLLKKDLQDEQTWPP